jgi:8-oxo-dGTP diphosphatase
VDQAINKVLLVDHKKEELWLPAGGHVEPNEHPKETVKREMIEELGVEAEFLLEEAVFLTVTKTVGQTAGHTDVSLWYVLNGDFSKEYLYDKEEFHQIKWFLPSDIPYNRSDPHMFRCIKKLVSLNVLRGEM